MAFLDVWNNKVNNVDNVMADDVNLLAEYISRNENNIETIKQNIKNISYAEVDSFSSGYAVVEDTKTIDSSEGPILINFVYPLFAETVETFGNVEINQIRIYNGELQKRTVGKEWEKINTYSLEYKGSLESTDSLPGDNSKGDMYNIEKESDIAIKVRKTKHLIPCSGAVDSLGELTASYDVKYDSWLNQDNYVELFDMVGNSLAVGVVAIRSGGQIIVQGTGLEEGTQVYYIQLQNQADNKEAQGNSVSLYETKTINIKPKQKLFYNGIDWDLFSDLSNYAEKATTLAGYGITDAYTKQQTEDQIEQRIKTIELTSSIDGNSWFDGVDWSSLNNLTSQLVKIKINYTDANGFNALAEGYVISVYGSGSYYSNTQQYLILGENKSSVTYVRSKYDESYFTQEDPYWTSWQVVAGLDGAYKKSETYSKTEINNKLQTKIETAITDPITVNTIYDLGEQTNLTIKLPSGQIGDFIQFDFISASTATTVAVTSASKMIGFDLVPEPSSIYTLYFDWGEAGYDGTSAIYGWRCNYSEYPIDIS